MTQNILITGAAGFLGSHLVEEILTNTNFNVIALCRMSMVGDMTRLVDSNIVQNHAQRVKFIYFDLKYEIPIHVSDQIGQVDYVVHAAANRHVDRSIMFPKQFFEDNVIGTVNLLEWYRYTNPHAKFINFLTDEVFGPAPMNYNFNEDDRWRPSNPYSGSKAGQGAAGICYHVTYNLPIITTYTMNIFGEKQNPEKLIPKSITNILQGRPIPVYAKLNEDNTVDHVGERHWLYVKNAANATVFLLNHGISGEHYNVVGFDHYTNDELIMKIGKILNKTPQIEYVDYHKSRPGHDRRYALDGNKLKNLGWTPPIDFDECLKKTIEWYTKIAAA